MSSVDELPDRVAHRAKCAAVNNPVEYAADDPTRSVRIPGGRVRSNLWAIESPVPQAPDLSRRGLGH